MAHRLEDLVQRGHSFAIVDEADSILIDEARTPLIIDLPDGVLNSYSEFLLGLLLMAGYTRRRGGHQEAHHRRPCRRIAVAA